MDPETRYARLKPTSPQPWFEQIARIHQQEIVEGFLSKLGSSFLTNLYRHLSGSKSAFLYAAIRGNEVIGFICGSLNTSKVYKEFVLSPAGAIAAVRLAPKLVSLSRVKRVLETLLYPAKQDVIELPKAEILNFCVDSRVQRSGVGRELFIRLQEEFARQGVDRIKIVTGANQVSAQRFYERHQAKQVTATEIHAGTQSLIYEYEIKDGAHASTSEALAT